ncbi:hypothetical protein PACTADRAFT_50639 [Pachysolen tannophilus NRRL Y-2460]|uniref:Zn(2)-C6 fungal-type domain-containing protein n=1 Tax=Pachysolen tannophilus NRRL Y-2460 TaxID=669874 RepID=A0A1E4TSR1_PACTA|nr:hypothetical protein PACTADRAFT_50639 [Pachysolen tannophilus NRRL Y-2460]
MAPEVTNGKVPSSLLQTWSLKRKKVNNHQSNKIPRRIKACFECRKAKIKCENNNGDYSNPCQRCLKTNTECVYEFKVSNYKKVDENGDNLAKHNDNNSTIWKDDVENRLQKFDNTLDNILSLLQNNQANASVAAATTTAASGVPAAADIPALLGFSSVPQEVNQLQLPALTSAEEKNLYDLINNATSLRADLQENSNFSTRRKISSNEYKKLNEEYDFRNLLNFSQVESLFEFFERNISPQLFGFKLSDFNIEKLWFNRQPSLLLLTVCTIASVHHPDLKHLSAPLKDFLERYSFKIMYNADDILPDFDNGNNSNNESEIYNTIISLCIAGFWLNQSFCNVALQLAKNYGFNTFPMKNNDSRESEVISTDIDFTKRLKLWYLLYILDSQQALAFNRKPIMDSSDNIIRHCRKLLLSQKKDSLASSKIKNYSTLTSDIRLVSQIECSQVTNEIFKGNSWDLLDPSHFGIPYNTNLELDKWMVRWTVLLSSMNGFSNSNVWSSKSTLIYYNFAKIHINSNFIRGMRDKSGEFPKWNSKFDDDFENVVSENNTGGFIEAELNSDDDEDDDEDESDEEIDEEIDEDHQNKQLAENGILRSENNLQVSTQIATSSAFNILNLVLYDKDIVDSLKYCPVHIHILLYYAVLITLNSPLVSSNNDFLLKTIKMTKQLLKLLIKNKPIDEKFGNKLIKNIRLVLKEKLEKILHDSTSEEGNNNNNNNNTRSYTDESNYIENDVYDDDDFIHKIKKELAFLNTAGDFIYPSTNAEEDEDDEYEQEKLKNKKIISAWPGSDPSHPVVAKRKH